MQNSEFLKLKVVLKTTIKVKKYFRIKTCYLKPYIISASPNFVHTLHNKKGTKNPVKNHIEITWFFVIIR